MQNQEQLLREYLRAIERLVRNVSQRQEEGLLPLGSSLMPQFNHTFFQLRNGSLYKALEKLVFVALDESEEEYSPVYRQEMQQAVQDVYHYLFISHYSTSLHQTAFLIPKEFTLDKVSDMLNRARLRIAQPNGLLSIKDTHQQLDVSRADIYTFIAAGRLHPIKDGRDRWMEREEVNRLQLELQREHRLNTRNSSFTEEV